MKQLIPMDDYGVFADMKDTPRASSLQVAEMFGKRHDIVLRDIANLDCSEQFHLLNFVEISYADSYGRKQKAVAMTRDGFTFLAMGYRGKKAAQFKEAYIKRFNDMEKFIRTLQSVRMDYPMLTENIKLLHDTPKPYHFSNEADMLNRIITGMTAKKFREVHNIQHGESIRPYLTDEQVWLMDILQKADIGLLISEPNFEARKRHLEWYKTKMLDKRYGRLSA